MLIFLWGITHICFSIRITKRTELSGGLSIKSTLPSIGHHIGCDVMYGTASFLCKAAGWSLHIGHRKVDGVCVRAFCTFKMHFVMEIKISWQLRDWLRICDYHCNVTWLDWAMYVKSPSSFPACYQVCAQNTNYTLRWLSNHSVQSMNDSMWVCHHTAILSLRLGIQPAIYSYR